jgi:hypothetical protein
VALSRSNRDLTGTVATVIQLDLRDLHEVHPMTANVLGSYSEAAAVTLEQFHEPKPRECTVTYRGEAQPAWLTWHPATEISRATHGSATDAKEAGAYAVAIATAHALQGWRARGRAHDGSGADVILTHPDRPPENFVKMEVSGVAPGKGEAHEVKELRRRLNEKIKQLGRGNLDLPGLAIVVGFETAQVHVVEPSK